MLDCSLNILSLIKFSSQKLYNLFIFIASFIRLIEWPKNLLRPILLAILGFSFCKKGLKLLNDIYIVYYAIKKNLKKFGLGIWCTKKTFRLSCRITICNELFKIHLISEIKTNH